MREKGTAGLKSTQRAAFASLALRKPGEFVYVDTANPAEVGQIEPIKDWVGCFPLSAQSRLRLTNNNGRSKFGLNQQWSLARMKAPERYAPGEDLGLDCPRIGLVFDFTNGEFVRFEGHPTQLFAIGWSSALPLSTLLMRVTSLDDGPGSVVARTSDSSIERHPHESILTALTELASNSESVEALRVDGPDWNLSWMSTVGTATAGEITIPLHEMSVLASHMNVGDLVSMIEETATPSVESLWSVICKEIADSVE